MSLQKSAADLLRCSQVPDVLEVNLSCVKALALFTEPGLDTTDARLCALRQSSLANGQLQRRNDLATLISVEQSSSYVSEFAISSVAAGRGGPASWSVTRH